MAKLARPLDRYVFGEFWRIFVTTALGFPVLVIVIDLTDNLDKYLNRNLPKQDIFLSYIYWLPDSMFMVLPAAVLFATVFAIGAFTRHAEVTAAKASGISFYRFIAPIVVGAFIATGIGLVLGELAPRANAKRESLLQERKFRGGTDRFNFAYSAEGGRVYKISALNTERGTIEGLEVERKGKGADYPTKVMMARSAAWDSTRHSWVMRAGTLHIVPDSNADVAFTFDSMMDRRLHETPRELMATPKAPTEMGYKELGRFIRAMERSGADVNELRVERMLKIAIPVTCLIILLFGAPLATSTQRGGAAYGVGVSLGTTIVFLMMIQLTKAIGGKGILSPEIAAWVPSILFGIVGVWLLARVRT